MIADEELTPEALRAAFYATEDDDTDPTTEQEMADTMEFDDQGGDE